MRLKAGHKKKSFFTKLLVPFLLLIVLFLIFLIFRFDLLAIRSVNVNLDQVDCVSEQQIKSYLNLSGQNFLNLDQKSVVRRLQEEFFCVRQVKLSKQLPNKITVDVSGRKGAAQIIATSSATPLEQFLVDEDGVIFSQNIPANLPTLYIGNSDLTIGKKLPPGLIKSSLDILNKLKTFAIEVKDAKIDQQKFLLVNTNMGTLIIFELNEKVNYQLAALQLIVTQAKINDEKMEFIDLRFEKPVIKYAPKKK